MKKFYLHMLLAAMVVPAGLMASDNASDVARDSGYPMREEFVAKSNMEAFMQYNMGYNPQVDYNDPQNNQSRISRAMNETYKCPKAKAARKFVDDNKYNFALSALAYDLSKKYAPVTKAADFVAGYLPNKVKDNVVTNNVARFSPFTAEDVDLALTDGSIKFFASILKDIQHNNNPDIRPYTSKTIARHAVASGITNTAASATVIGAKKLACLIADQAGLSKYYANMEKNILVKYVLNPVAYAGAQTCVNAYIADKLK